MYLDKLLAEYSQWNYDTAKNISHTMLWMARKIIVKFKTNFGVIRMVWTWHASRKSKVKSWATYNVCELYVRFMYEKVETSRVLIDGKRHDCHLAQLWIAQILRFYGNKNIRDRLIESNKFSLIFLAPPAAFFLRTHECPRSH